MERGVTITSLRKWSSARGRRVADLFGIRIEPECDIRSGAVLARLTGRMR